jgi:phosphomannomutase
MTLIKSISGIRGTIGGKPGDGLNPLDIVKFTAAYAKFIIETKQKKSPLIVLGRDARISGNMVYNIVSGTLQGMGINVLNIGLGTTPTVEIAVTEEKADGGIILTASHNPKQWNALKLLNSNGEFISDEEGKIILQYASSESFDFADIDNLGTETTKLNYDDIHIQKIIRLPLVDVKAIKAANFKVVIDCVNSVGGIVIPKLLETLGVKEIIKINCEPTGHFAHNPEPLPEHLNEISEIAKKAKVDVGFVVDPDVDRLAIINEDGTMFGEEYTLVAISDYILKNKKGNTVSNLSSTRALRDITEKAGGKYFAAAVGEVNVVRKMKDCNAVIGGEGNGGVIYPALHYGRDALVGIALFLSYIAKMQIKCSSLKALYPQYFIAKKKIQLTPGINVDLVLNKIKVLYNKFNIIDIDGVKIEFEDSWIHLRKSNTEPIIRIYAESKTFENANRLADKIINEIELIVKS